MNAMLEPRIVAASTQGRDLSRHGFPRLPALIVASSHGCFISNVDAHGLRTDSRQIATWFYNLENCHVCTHQPVTAEPMNPLAPVTKNAHIKLPFLVYQGS
jgi:hypothetical protein